MNSQIPDSKPSPAFSAPWRPGKRLAVAICLLLLAWLFVAYLLLPQVWREIARVRPSFDDNPRLTKTGDGHPGGPLNVALVGSEEQLKAVMTAANWYEANPLGMKNDLKIAFDSILSRSYDEAPVSKLYLFDRPEDIAFEQAVDGSPRHRHHVRFWRNGKASSDGRPVWIGAASYDERVGLSLTTGQITHHIAADVDQERDHVFATLETTKDLAETWTVKGFQTVLKGTNGGGDPWFTDGDLRAGVISETVQ
jgi:hypothetical protein